MSAEAVVTTKRIQVNQPLESSIQIGLAALLVVGCLLILKPFIPLLLWAIIITIASYPTFLKLERVLKGRRGLAATVWTLLLLAVLIVPLVLLAKSLVAGHSAACRPTEERNIGPSAAARERRELASHRRASL